MITTATCPRCGTIVTLDLVHIHCTLCGCERAPGEYIIALRGQYVGQEICTRCIMEQVGLNLLGEAATPNGAGTRPLGKLGPSEVK